MRTGALIAVAVTMLLAFACGGSSPPNTPATGAGGFDVTKAMADIQQLATTIGARPPGSDAGQKAADFIAERFGALRYGLVRGKVSYETNPNRDATVVSGATTIAATTFAGTASGNATGAAVTIGSGDAAGIAGRSLQGKVAIASRGAVAFADIYSAAKTAGAAALVIVNSDAAPLVGRLPVTATIPVVAVSSADQAALRAAADASTSLTVAVPPAAMATTENIVARPPNGDPCAVVIGANYDTVAGTPGANDNASGIAILLEVARLMTVPKASPSLCFVAFGARVDGARGSAAYLASLPSTPALAAVVNLYGLGNGSKLVFYGDSRMASAAAESATAAGLQSNAAGGRASYTTDADAFRAASIPALDVTFDRYSTAQDATDTAAKIDVNALAKAGSAVLGLVQTLARQGGP